VVQTAVKPSAGARRSGLLLLVHILATVGVFGADLVLVTLGFCAVFGADPSTIYPAAQLVASTVVAPLAFEDPSSDGLLVSRRGVYRRGMSRLAVMVSGRAQPGKRDEVRRQFEAHLAPHAIANASQPIVVWSADKADADAFYLWEVYTDPAAMEANGRSAWFGEYMGAVGPLLAGQPEMTMAEAMWLKPTIT
jgi:quinol monooxygenase YgiN